MQGMRYRLNRKITKIMKEYRRWAAHDAGAKFIAAIQNTGKRLPVKILSKRKQEEGD
jgi:hypothetical protein